jgi:hypothetical protein
MCMTVVPCISCVSPCECGEGRIVSVQRGRFVRGRFLRCPAPSSNARKLAFYSEKQLVAVAPHDCKGLEELQSARLSSSSVTKISKGLKLYAFFQRDREATEEEEYKEQ